MQYFSCLVQSRTNQMYLRRKSFSVIKRWTVSEWLQTVIWPPRFCIRSTPNWAHGLAISTPSWMVSWYSVIRRAHRPARYQLRRIIANVVVIDQETGDRTSRVRRVCYSSVEFPTRFQQHMAEALTNKANECSTENKYARKFSKTRDKRIAENY